MRDSLQTVLDRKGGPTHYVPSDASVSEAVLKMHEHNVGSLLIKKDEQLAGIITERDVLYRVVDEGMNPAQTPVSKVMTVNPKSATPNTTVSDAMRQVTEQRVRHLPVLNDGKIVGLVSSGDLTRWVVDDQSGEIDKLRGRVKKQGNKFKVTIALVVAFAILIAVGIATS